MLSNIEEIIKDLKNGKMIIIVDDEDRENEGDLAFAADKVTPEMINFMSIYGKGLICVPMLGSKLDSLDITSMVNDNTSSNSTAFTISVDAIKGATTGISADDRSNTIKMLISDTTLPEDLARPGHIFPLRYAEGGVLKRDGQTESIVDLCILSDLYPAGVICEIINEDGTMARRNDLEQFSAEHDIKIVSVEDIIKYRKSKNLLNITPDEPKETFIRKTAEYPALPTSFGSFNIKNYKSYPDGLEHVVLQKGKLNKHTKTPIVRVHSECITGEVFKSSRCDCGEQLEMSLNEITNSEYGILIYLRQEGRGIGLKNKILAYKLQEEGYDTVEANEKLGFPPDLREYGIGAQIIKECGIQKMKLMTNNPKKIVGLEGYGLEITSRESLDIAANENNKKYLKTKKDKLGHFILGDESNE